MKIISSLKDGDLLFKLRKRGIKAPLAREKEIEFYTYNKLYKKYSNIIENSNYVWDRKNESNYIWICWLQGYDNAPDLVKACINSIRNEFKEKEIVIITNDNLDEYIDFPKSIKEKFQKGIISFTHLSDLIRIALLSKYGGLWVDSTVLCTSSDIKEILSRNDFFIFKMMELNRNCKQNIVASSWFIYSKYPENPILNLTKDLLYKYWEDYDYLIIYFLFHLFFTMACDKYNELFENVELYNSHSPHVLMFELDKKYDEKRFEEIKKMSSIHKLQRHKSYLDVKESFYSYIVDNYK